ncbi:TonB-dependent receptor [Sphingobacterium sp. SGG-5]|nr:TonB-dependent receptor [Sphingobacterium sp. SGG-5]
MLDSRQQIEVTGTVTGENNEPLPAVSVAVKGTSIRAVSDTQGKFRIHVPNREAVLVFSYLGYSAQERVVGNDEVVYIKLIRAVSEIEEVVVNIGYGEVKKEDLTGAVGQVNVEELQKAPVATFDQALAGRVAGVQVSGNDGQPGTPNNIVIRGNNSLTQDNSPLYVVDGFPVETFTESPVSPSDIESIHVLKDASATAIYGSRGANGVIIITTKKGTDSDPVISLNSYYGFQKVIRRLEMMSPYEFVKYQNELNPITTERLYLDGRTLDDYKDMPGIDMQDALYQVAPAHNHDIAFRGGNKGTQYAVFANLFKSDGIIQNSGYTRGQGKFTLSQQLKKNIRAYLNANYTKTVTSGSIISDPTGGIPSLSIIYSALGYRPISGFDDVDLMDELFDPAIITETPTDYRLNPVISVNNEINERVLNSIIVNGHIDFKLNKRLTLKVKGGLISNEFNTSKFYNSKTQIGNPNYPTSKGTTGGIYSRRTDNWLNENTLTYNRTIKKHKLNILAGFTMQNNKLSYSGYTSSFIEDEDLGIDGIDLSTSLVPDTYRKEWSLASFLGRVNYDYNKKYLVTLSFRSDGSSKFRGNNKWGHFPSGAFAWRMSNEPFIKDIRFISDAKLRVGYGMTGNNRVDEYATYSGIAFPFTSYYSFNNATPGRGASLQTTTGVPDLRWETTSQFNLGYDLSVIRNRIQFTFDYYNKTTTDLLLNANLPYTTGYLTAFQNIGSVRNHGLEFTIQTDIIKTKNFLWSSAFNISFNRNKILKLQPAQSYRLANVSFVGDFHNVAPYVAKVDQPMGIIYGAISDGLYQYGDFDLLPDGSYFLKNEVPTNGRARNTLQPGDMKFVDVNNDGTITAEDYVPIGNANPRHVGGFSNDFNYRNFDLNIFLQWSYGNDILNGNRLYFEQNTYNLYNLNMFASVTDRWTPENQNTTIPRVGGVPPRIYHTNIIEDGSFLRLKTVSLGYTFSDKVLLPAKIKTARIYMAAQNIFTWTNYSGSDPEVSVRNSPLTPGFDWSAYPRARTITFGLNVSF